MSVGGVPRPLRPRARTLLAILLARANRAVAPDVLADRLWVGAPPPTAGSALRVHLAEVRAAVRLQPSGPSRLATTTDGYLLTVEPGELDADRLVAVLDRPPDQSSDLAREALEEWRGLPFEGLDDIEELGPLRVALEQRREELCLRIVDADLAAGRYERAAAEAARWAADRPTSDALAARRVLAVTGSGDAVAALGILRHHIARLREEYGIDPSPALTRLELDVLDNRLPSRPTPAGPPIPASSVDGLVQRAAAFQAVDAALADPANPSPLVVVTGEAGSGKSALLRAIAGRRADAVMMSAVDPAQPLSVVHQLVEQLEGVPPPGQYLVTGEATDHAAVIAGTLDQMLGSHRSSLVLVDDADGLDADTGAVLRRLIERSITGGVAWVLSARQSRVPFLTSADVLERTTYVPLLPLDRTGIAELLGRAHVTTSEVVVDEITEWTGGVPFLAVLAARHLVGGRSLGSPPEASSAFVGAMIDALGDGDRVVLEAAALDRPGPLDLATIAAVVDVTHVAAVAAAERAIAVGLLDDRSGDVRFRHALARDAARGSVRGPRRELLHARFVDVLEARVPTDAARLAGHARAAGPGHRGEAARWTAQAGLDALEIGAARSAADQLEEALSMADPDTEWVDECRWRLALSDAHLAAGGLDGARAAAAEAATWAERHGDAAGFAAAAARLAGPMVPTGSDRDRAELVLTEALEWLPATALDERVEVAEALIRALSTVTGERVTRWRRDLEPVLASSSEARDSPIRQTRALLGLRTLAVTDPGSADRRHRLATEALAVARRTGTVSLVLTCHRALVADRCEVASSSIDADAAAYRALADEVGADFHRWLARRVEAALARARGDGDRVEAIVAASAPLQDGIEPDLARRLDFEAVFVDHLLTHRLAALAPLMRRLEAPEPEVAPLLALAGAAVAAAAGTPQNPKSLADLLGRVPEGPLSAGAAALAALAVRPGHGGADVVAMIEARLRPRTGQMVVLDSGAFMLGPVDRHLAHCRAVAGDTAAVSYHAERADSLAAAFAPAWVGWTLQEGA